MKVTRRSISLLAALALTVAISTPLVAAPAAKLWERWLAHDTASTAAVDHSAWTLFLGRYLVAPRDGGATLLAYAQVSPADRQILDRYVGGLEQVAVSRLSKAEQRAFWINLYNAATVRLVLDRYPVASIRDIRLGGLFASGPWDAPLLTVEAVRLSLNDIEHRILRPIWRDPRLHYAVNCASLGCPNLQSQAFTVENSERLLDKGAREYINDRRGVSLVDGRLTLSSIYSWFAQDFGGDREALLAHIRRYAAPDLAAALASYRGGISYAYDWSLNEP